MTHPLYYLYPFHSIELVAVFVYGNNFTRQMNILSIPDSVLMLIVLLVIFMNLSVIFLCIMRKKLKLRRNDIISSYVDVLIAFIAGGNLRIQHHWEKWFFGILLTAAFFITSLFASDLLYYVYRILNQKVSTFEQLTEIKAPIYNNPTLTMYNTEIHGMLRLVSLF